ncbi:MAG: hypothetical protein KHZ90_08335 [Veillonella parvula]|uniref:Uncharacterized protein n=1 Tax=Veillonella parvula TaxID=29466 RepID=A0A943ABG7_VEIPA|nr:hypothetical protein [Veillonella parvula]MBS4893768.1 hypothetical protein [Veillonella parvula]
MLIVKCIDDMVDGISKGKIYNVVEIIKHDNKLSYWLKDDYGVFNEFKSDRFEILEQRMVYCVNCKHLILEEIHKGEGDYIVSCPYEKECEIYDIDDGRYLSERPYYEEEYNNEDNTVN